VECGELGTGKKKLSARIRKVILLFFIFFDR
jgi:hypothetical protein